MSNFANLNTATLFQGNRHNILNHNSSKCKEIFESQMTVNALNAKNTKKPIDSSVLLINIMKQREKLKECYESILFKCWDKIVATSAIGYTSVIYEVPQIVDAKYVGYDPNKCIETIKEEFEKQSLNVKSKGTKILISWDDLEEKLSKKKSSAQKNIYQNNQ